MSPEVRRAGTLGIDLKDTLECERERHIARPRQALDRGATARDGVVITSATRTILDAAEAGTAPDQVELAVIQAVERGLAAPDQLRRDSAMRGRRVVALIEGALRRAVA